MWTLSALCLAQRGDQEWSPSQGATRDMGGRAFLRAEWLRKVMLLRDARYLGDQDPPSLRYGAQADRPPECRVV